MSNLSNLEQRALSAYYRTASRTGGSVNQPGDIHEVEFKGLPYIYMSNVNGLLAVYRVRTINGESVLKGLKRYPVGFAESLGYEG